MVEILKFDGLKKGKNLLVFGAVHGNEICGPKSIYKIIEKIKNKEIVIENGSLTFIPVCNYEAYQNNKRFIDINLNRVFKKIDNPIKYEEFISQILIKYIGECDCLLDIHSMPTDGPSFTFLDINTKAMEDFVKIQNFENIMVGWNEIFGGDDNSSCGYAIKNNKVCATIECGNHNDSNCINLAETAIINSMAFLKIINTPLILNEKEQKYIKMDKVYYKEKEGELSKFWKHLDFIKKGEIIANFNDGNKIIAEYDCLIMLPHNNNTPIGVEWFYVGNYL